MLELDDIQSGVLRPRPTPYVATYIALRIGNRQAGRALMKHISNAVTSAAHPESPLADTWVSAALTYQGLKALGVPQESLDTFSWEFRQGMAARAKELGDFGESEPSNWEKPLGGSDVHVIIVAVSPDAERLEAAVARARETYQTMTGIEAIWRQNCHALPNEKEPFGFRDGISHPAIEGSGIAGSNPHEQPLKAGEFVLGYRDEIGGVQKTTPEILGHNGTYVVFRKLHQRVADFRRFLRISSKSSDEEELLAAKVMGRWRSGAPLALCPFHDDPELGADPQRNNAFMFEEDDKAGLKTPGGSHIRRTNPRDASIAGVVRIHRMIRRGTAYGPLLPEGALDDDGADRGIMFAFVGAHIGRQFEFVQSQWINDGVFFGAGEDKDPVIGSNGHGGSFTVPPKTGSTEVSGHTKLCSHAGRRILLHAGAARPALARQPSDVSPMTRSLTARLLISALLSAACCFAVTRRAIAQNRGVYPLGMSATTSGVTPEPGFTYVNQLLIYSRDESKGPDGEVLGTGSNSVVMDMNTIAWVSKKKIFGAKFSMTATLPIARNSLTSDVTGPVSGGAGFADSYYQPFILGWDESRFAIRAVYGFLAPTGRFRNGANNNVGSGYWTHAFSSGQTFYLTRNKATAISAFQMYEVHTTQKSTSIRPGDTLDLDYSVMQSFSLGGEKRMQLGLVGYNARQTTDKTGPTITAEQSQAHYKVNALGVGSNLSLSAKINVGFKYFQEFANRSTFQGHSIQFSGSIKF